MIGKKYIWISLSVIAASFAVLFTSALFVAFRSSEHQRVLLEQRMEHMAIYAAEALGEAPAWGTETTSAERLSALAVVGGFERITIADSLGLVIASSSSMFLPGDDLATVLLDSMLFARVLSQGTPVMTPIHTIDGVLFKSLYFPVRIAGAKCVAIVEADQNYFAVVRQFGRMAGILALTFAIVLGVLVLSIIGLVRRLDRAYELARRNEELAFLGRTSAELAHELKNPLGIIKSSTDVLQKKYDPAGAEKVFVFLSGEIMRLSRLITDILNFSREKHLERTLFALRPVVETKAQHLLTLWPSVVTSIDISQNLMLIGDPDALGQIITNLLNNSAAAMTDGCGKIAISTQKRGKALALFVSDNGPGIPDAIARRVFDPFVSGSRAGTGLGLAIVKSLSAASGWEITLESHTKECTRFTLVIPEGLWEESLS